MPKPQIIAHRGAWKNTNLPQNSIASLEAAKKLGCDGSELDVHLTADGKVVVNHDHDFYGIEIEQSTYEQLLTKQHPNGENIPLLSDFLTRAKELEIPLFLEIKTPKSDNSHAKELIEKTLQFVAQYDLKKSVHYICFSADITQKVLLSEPSATVSYLNGNLEPAEIAKRGWSGIDYRHTILREHPQWIEQARQLGLLVNVWTVNNDDDIQYFIGSGADFITTDEPEKLLEIIQ